MEQDVELGVGEEEKAVVKGEGDHIVGRANYSVSELEHMLESVCQFLPISDIEWDLVVDCSILRYACFSCDAIICFLESVCVLCNVQLHIDELTQGFKQG